MARANLQLPWQTFGANDLRRESAGVRTRLRAEGERGCPERINKADFACAHPTHVELGRDRAPTVRRAQKRTGVLYISAWGWSTLKAQARMLDSARLASQISICAAAPLYHEVNTHVGDKV